MKIVKPFAYALFGAVLTIVIIVIFTPNLPRYGEACRLHGGVAAFGGDNPVNGDQDPDNDKYGYERCSDGTVVVNNPALFQPTEGAQ